LQPHPEHYNDARENSPATTGTFNVVANAVITFKSVAFTNFNQFSYMFVVRANGRITFDTCVISGKRLFTFLRISYNNILLLKLPWLPLMCSRSWLRLEVSP
jgi:hypothetical protein